MAKGSCHSNEGLKLEQLVVRGYDAELLVEGSLLGPVQEATVTLSDFPVDLLHPVFR